MTTTRGLVALGDSITHGHGEPTLGVHPQSWAQWLAEALELPFTNLSVDGAMAAAVLREQVPRLRGPYDVGCVYAGVNDVRVPGFDGAAYERDMRAITEAVGAASERVVLCTIPADLGRPRAAPKPRVANRVIRRIANDLSARIVELEDLAGAPHLLPDAVHPTALGQLEIGDRAARALGAPRLPSQTVEVHASRRARTGFATRHGVLLAGDLRRRVVERFRPQSPESRRG
jgi:lysophospholipase L1-like esterase